MKHIAPLFIITALLMISFCGGDDPVQPDPNKDIATSAEYFPIENQANQWFYTLGGNKDVKRILVGDTVMNQTADVPDTCIKYTDSVFYQGVLTDFTGGVWKNDSIGNHVYLIDAVLLPKPKLSIPFGLNINESHNYNSSIYLLRNDSIFAAGTLSGKLTNLGGVTKSVPAGTFDDVLKIHYTATTTDTSYEYNEYYAPGIGLIDDGDYILDSAFIGGIWYRP